MSSAAIIVWRFKGEAMFTVIILTIGTIKAELTLQNKIRLLLRSSIIRAALFVFPFAPLRRIAALKIENPNCLTLKAPITTAAVINIFSLVFRENKT